MKSRIVVKPQTVPEPEYCSIPRLVHSSAETFLVPSNNCLISETLLTINREHLDYIVSGDKLMVPPKDSVHLFTFFVEKYERPS